MEKTTNEKITFKLEVRSHKSYRASMQLSENVGFAAYDKRHLVYVWPGDLFGFTADHCDLL